MRGGGADVTALDRFTRRRPRRSSRNRHRRTKTAADAAAAIGADLGQIVKSLALSVTAGWSGHVGRNRATLWSVVRWPG
jgi:prolyl-tRNA editing enzyme YbaK/EbsC (Cys-tRNA(Pro) deacylase)